MTHITCHDTHSLPTYVTIQTCRASCRHCATVVLVATIVVLVATIVVVVTRARASMQHAGGTTV